MCVCVCTRVCVCVYPPPPPTTGGLPAAGCGRPHRIDPRPAPTHLRSKRNGGRCNAAVAQPRDLRPEKSSPENRRFSRAPPTALAPRLPYTPPPAPTHLRSKRNGGRCNAAVVGARTARKIVSEVELTNSTINVLFVLCSNCLSNVRGRLQTHAETDARRPPARIGETPGSNCLFSNSFD